MKLTLRRILKSTNMTRTRRILDILTLFVFIGSVLIIAEAETFTQYPCANKQKCNECIQTKGCAWCMMGNFTGKERCLQSSISYIECPKDYIINPISERTIIQNRELTKAGSISRSSGRESSSSSGGGAASEPIVQLSPQNVSLKIRINEPYRLDFRYSQAKDYPVDLYYLMDLSQSMEDDKKNVSALAALLSSTMRNLTSNFKLGFGSFVDKLVMPYVSTIPSKMEKPCTTCTAPYGYRNHMSLDEDTAHFSKEVEKAAVSGNLDAPEGGFDAIMQAIVCRDRIGWRHQARRLLVFATDADFHYAGDGKLGGIIEPNDGYCHLDGNGLYTHSTLQDYPSISQINHYAKKNSINIIFAVTKEQIDLYSQLSKHIEGSSSAQLLNDSSNVVELVRKEYKKISSSIEIKDNANSFVKINYYSNCLKGDSGQVQTTKCDGLKIGTVVNFTAEITVTECPSDPKDWKQQIQIYPVGINETLVVDLEMLCSCPCESPTHPTFESNSPKCHNQGDYMCGICECNDMNSGRTCECSNSNIHAGNDPSICKADNETGVECSGRGNCLCGICECDKRPNLDEVYSGKFCECDNFSCDRHNQLLCSGPDHGTCNCGVCNCKPGWSGLGCDCLSSKDTCKVNSEGEICSGHGKCECGVCKCALSKEGRYSGRYCENCPTCAKRCVDLKDCVQCQMWKTGPLKDEAACAANCTFITLKPEDKNYNDEDENRVPCSFYDENDCTFKFNYTEKDGLFDIFAQKERKCQPKVYTFGIVLGVIAAIVLVGLAILLLWKLLTTIHDRREFARFENERMGAKWDNGGNPIYKQATTTFNNPMFDEK